MLLAIHIGAGALALLLGAVALVAKKGGLIHRRSGLVFVCAMTVMATTAAILGNAVGGLITLYFVGTAWTTVHRPSASTRRINTAALAFAVALALLAVVVGIRDIGSQLVSPGGVPFRIIGAMSFVLAAVLLLAAAGDLRTVRSGMSSGGARLARHLWRMCFALFMAAGSFFSIRERVAEVLPEPFTTGPMRVAPIALLFGVMFYWLWRVRRPQRLAVLVEHASIPQSTRAK